MGNNYDLVLFPTAVEDMEKIFEYIAVDLSNPIAAIKMIDSFNKAFENICFFPESYPLTKNEFLENKNFRKAIVKKYIIFFTVEKNEIKVYRVIYGMRNLEKLL